MGFDNFLAELKMFIMLKEGMNDNRWSDIVDIKINKSKNNIIVIFYDVNYKKITKVSKNIMDFQKTTREQGLPYLAVEFMANYLKDK